MSLVWRVEYEQVASSADFLAVDFSSELSIVWEDVSLAAVHKGRKLYLDYIKKNAASL